MIEKTEDTSPDIGLIDVVTEIVAAYVSNNSVSTTDLPKLIADTHEALRVLATNAPAAVEEELKPAVPIKRSVKPDYIVCLEDGKKFKSLKRHLGTHSGMTPEQYRERWNLPADYPMVAANYSATRSSLAKSNGLGRKAAEIVVAKNRRKPKQDL